MNYSEKVFSLGQSKSSYNVNMFYFHRTANTKHIVKLVLVKKRQRRYCTFVP